MKYAIVLKALLFTALLGSVVASADSRVPIPHPPKGKGDHCVLPTPEMRRNHMKYILHERHETMHKGIRNPQFSLEGCIHCHVVYGADGKPVSIKSPKHFCNSCHGYAAVHIDCFECHASTPTETPEAKRLFKPIGLYDSKIEAPAGN
jgi:hypothetical protein